MTFGDDMNSGSGSQAGLDRTGRWDLRTLVAIVAMVCVAVTSGLVLGRRVHPAYTDTTADWLVVAAVAHGLDPWQDLRDLSEEFGVPYLVLGEYELGLEQTYTHPRTPGALLLMWPLRFVTVEAAYQVAVALIILAYLATVAVVMTRREIGPPDRVALVGLSGLLTAAYFATLAYGTHSALLMLAIAVMWIDVRKRDGVVGGLALGIAGLLRVFPLLIVIPLWMHGRQKAAATAVLVFVAVNVGAAISMNLSLLDAATALSLTGRTWMKASGNGSIGMPLARIGIEPGIISIALMTAAVVSAVVIGRKRISLDRVLGPVILASLLLSPLSWEHYDLVGLLAAGFALLHLREDARNDPVARLLGGWFVLQVASVVINRIRFSPVFTAAGTTALAGRILLLYALLLIWRRSEPDPSGSTDAALIGVVPGS